MAGGDAEPFWAFSLALYAEPAVASACLRLQDEAGLDVNLALFCVYAEQVLGRALDRTALAALAAAVASWNETVVKPLRTLRQGLREAGEAALRDRVKEAELMAEAAAQRRILAAFAALDPVAVVPGPSNLRRYAGPAADELERVCGSVLFRLLPPARDRA